MKGAPPGLTALPTALLLVGLVSSCSPAPGAGPAPHPPAPTPASTPAEPVYSWRHATVGRGGTLDATLERLGLEASRRAAVTSRLGQRVDLRRLSPRTGLALAENGSGKIEFLTCRPEFDRYIRLSWGTDGAPTLTEHEVPVERSVRTVGGVVQSSVAEALAHLEDSSALTVAFADVFQWDVDLFVDPRPEDRVRIVYETLELGAPPQELPPFGEELDRQGDYLGLGRILAASYDGRIAQAEAFWVAEDGHGGDYYDAAGNSLRKTFLKSPLNYRRISSRFSRARRHPITRRVVPHHGVDFVAAPGTPVVAAADGRVVRVGWDGALGKTVRIRHGNGYATVYGHLRGYARGIRRGTQVTQNQVIGYVGSTGRTTGAHLHYTMQYHGRAIDPLRFANPAAEPLDPSRLGLLEEAQRTWRPLLTGIEFEPAAQRFARAARPAAPPRRAG